MTTMGGRQSSRMQSDVWLTPPRLLNLLGRFDLDPCAAPAPRPWPTATTHYALPDDGLALPWRGRVWLNPPYSRLAVHWLRRLAAHGTGTALIFARTETTWFVDTVWRCADAALFLDGRINFHRQDGTRAEWNGGAPSVLVAYGRADAGCCGRAVLPGRLSPAGAVRTQSRPPPRPRWSLPDEESRTPTVPPDPRRTPMDRIYMNRRDGERRIHVEIEEQEIADLLDSPDSVAARRLDEILRTALRAFAGGPS